MAKNPGDTGIAYYSVAARLIPVVGVMLTVHEAQVSLNNDIADSITVTDDTHHAPFRWY